MSISTVQLYAIASVFVILILVVVIAYFVWYCYWRKRQGKGFEKVPSRDHGLPVVKTPTIDINTVEFTLPNTVNGRDVLRPYSWAGSSTNESDKCIDIENQINSRALSKSEASLGLLKPELYVTSEESDYEFEDDLPCGNIGRVWFSLEYDAGSEKLIVTVDRVKNLPGRQQRTSLALSSSATSCDPFLRLYLLPDEKRYLQSKMKRKTRNPTFKETFMFTMSYSLLIERTLRITVFDVDRFMRQTTIGHVLVPLADLDITVTSNVWRDVEKASQISSNGAGRLQIGLTHFPNLNRVAVNVIRGQQIGNDDITLPDSYVKITYSVLSKVHKVKKTNVQKGFNDPFYNQTVEFKIDQQGMDFACLNFEVFHSTSGIGKNDKSLGSFIVGGSLCARGKELEHWSSMVQKPQTVVKDWHDLKMM